MTLPVVFTANGPSGYNLTKSLRFRSSASAYLNRTPASAGNRQKWTWSGWVKRGGLSSGSYMDLFTALSGANDFTEVRYHFNTNDDTIVFTDIASGTTYAVYSTNIYRDPSAWYHIVCSVDTTQATNTNRVKLYVNGVQVTQNAGGSGYPLQNTNTSVNATVEHRHGGVATYGRYFDGYMAEINLIDGQALTPSSFGETSTTTGVWIPKKYTGTYGTNGFYLPFTDTTSTSTLGTDFSGNSNTWTVNNISLTSGSTYDSMTDVPTNTSATTANYCVMNPLNSANNGTLGGGNLNIDSNSGSASAQTTAGTMSMKSGKYYFEYTRVQASNGMYFGIIRDDIFISGGNVGFSAGEYGYFVEGSGTLFVNGSTTSSWITAFAQGNTGMVAYDADTGKVWFGRNGVWGGSGDPAAGTSPAATVNSFGSYGYVSYVRVIGGGSPAVEQGAINFGQRPFSYTPPTGFVALNTFNLPTPTIGATASTIANEYFDATTYTGTGSTQNITNSGSMQPDWVWIKNRSSTNSHQLTDSVRGVNLALASDLTIAEFTGNINAFNTNGFQLTGATNAVNASGQTYVAWQWRASNATAVTNTAGSITSTVSANTTAGFSIVTFTMPSTNLANTVGHGLGVAPAMYIVKSRSVAASWFIYHQSLGATQAIVLNSTNASSTSQQFWNNTAPTSSVFSIGQAGVAYWDLNATMVAYCFAPIAGYSAFGSYTGNGSSDGPFVYLGFRPKFVMIKNATTGSSEWVVYDSVRSTFNVMGEFLFPNLSDAAGSGTVLDFLSNGFKLKIAGGGTHNTSGNTYIYMAFAESPFKYANAR